MDDATQKLVDEPPAWLDRHGDVWVFRNGMGWSFETRPFTREHIEKKWGPLVPLEAAQRPPVSPEVEALEQELFKHQPVLSMRDGSIAGCQCMDRVFYTRTEDWGTHLAEVFESLARFSVPSQPVYDEEKLREMAQRIVPDAHLGLSRGEGALHLALATVAREAIEDVYADCGDSDARVLGTNVGKSIAHRLVAALRGGELTREETNDA